MWCHQIKKVNDCDIIWYANLAHFSMVLPAELLQYWNLSNVKKVQQLAEIRHRGAFEQAFAGFCQVCAFIWKQESLNDYPIKLLENTLNDLKQNEGNR